MCSKLDDLGRSYATGKRKDADRPRLGQAGHRQDHRQRQATSSSISHAPCCRWLSSSLIVAAAAPGPVRRRLHRHRRRPLRPGWCCPSRHLQGAHLLRSRPARYPQEGWLPDPRQPRRRAQEIRQGEGPPFVPVLQALSFISGIADLNGASAPFFCVCRQDMMPARPAAQGRRYSAGPVVGRTVWLKAGCGRRSERKVQRESGASTTMW
jgi:hypothetical protein